ncbi:unnamed protein product [Urochloa decumbens]|uniref:Uncharacterized protein n=1 Tax=Urochloa decumbens TaxID=240449 RepID=A0ABC9BZM4_9POAL
MSDSHAVDIASLAQQLRDELVAAVALAAPLASGCPIVIAQVGELTRNVDSAEYEPQHVAIGLYYHRTDSPHLARDDVKLRCLAAVLEKAATAGGATLEVYLDEVARIEARARSCYAHTGGGARSILDVRLDGRRCGGALEIPHLNIDAETRRLLRNMTLTALEQSNPSPVAAGSHVTAYRVMFVSQLACTARDVDLLSRRGVIAHGMGSHGEVAELFADQCKGVAFGGADDPGGNYLHATWLAVEGRFRSRPHGGGRRG